MAKKQPSAETVSASELKARCAEVIDRVANDLRPVTVTKRGKPVARIVPIEPEGTKSLVGYARGRLKVTGDLLEPIDVDWEAR
jgi:prevent-host-death family protein